MLKKEERKKKKAGRIPVCKIQSWWIMHSGIV